MGFALLLALVVIFLRTQINHELLTAVQADDEKQVKHLLFWGADANQIMSSVPIGSMSLTDKEYAIKYPNTKFPSKKPILIMACISGNPTIVSELIKHGANKNYRMPDGRTPLHYAAIKSDSGALRVLLDSGMKPDVADNSGRTPLHVASECANSVNCKILVQHSASISKRDHSGATPLRTALAKNFPRNVIFLLKNGASLNDFKLDPLKLNVVDVNDDNSQVVYLPLVSASGCPDNALFKYIYGLLDQSERALESPPAFCAAVYTNHFDRARFLTSKGLRIDPSTLINRGDGLLKQVISGNDIELFRYMLVQGFDMNRPTIKIDKNLYSLSPLALSCADFEYPNYPIVLPGISKHIYVKWGVEKSIRYQNIPIDKKYSLKYAFKSWISGNYISQFGELNPTASFDNANVYPLKTTQTEEKNHSAKLKIINELLDRNVDIHEKPNETFHPLFFVTADTDLVKRFISKGADVRGRNEFGENVLMKCKNMSPESFEALIKAGADVNAQSKSGMTPLMCAVNFANLPILSLLLKHGADPAKRYANGQTPYSIARRINYEPMIRIFEQAGVTK